MNRLIAAISIVYLLSTSVVYGVQLRKVAITGDIVPGTSNSIFGGTSRVSFNNVGQVAFHATMMGGPGPLGYADSILLESDGQLVEMARTYSHAPGFGSDVNFGRLTGVQLNDLGNIAFIGGTYSDSSENYSGGIWTDRNGQLEPAIRDGDVLPGVENGYFSGASQLFFNKRGQLAFYGFVEHNFYVTRGNDAGFWSEGGGSLELVAREGDRPPGLPDNTAFHDVHTFGLSDSGHTSTSWACRQVSSGGLTLVNGGVWTNVSGELALVHRFFDPLPGDPIGDFQGPPRAPIESSPRIPFMSYFRVPTILPPYFNDFPFHARGIWAIEDGNIELVAIPGGSIPNGPPNLIFGDINPDTSQWLVSNERGETTFIAEAHRTTNGVDPQGLEFVGIWAEQKVPSDQCVAAFSAVFQPLFPSLLSATISP